MKPTVQRPASKGKPTIQRPASSKPLIVGCLGREVVRALKARVVGLLVSCSFVVGLKFFDNII